MNIKNFIRYKLYMGTHICQKYGKRNWGHLFGKTCEACDEIHRNAEIVY